MAHSPMKQIVLIVAANLFLGVGTTQNSMPLSDSHDATTTALILASKGRDVETAECDPARNLRVLFVGNSFTYVHNVPRLLEGIAASLPGPCIETSMIASGGATLEAHWNSDSVAQRIREGRWTHVVLNDQSTFGEGWFVEGASRVGTSGRELAHFTRLFVDVIRGAGAKPVLLAHWSDDGAPARDQQALDYLFAKVARSTGSDLSPVGTAIKRMRTELPDAATPYFTDKHHLSSIGAYMEALILYSTLVDRSPIGAAQRIEGSAIEFNRGIVFPDSIITLADIASSEAVAVQRIAVDIYSKSRGRIPVVALPTPLSAEFPKVPDLGESINRSSLRGHWRGMSMALPNPAGDSVQVEFSLNGDERGIGVPDSLHLRTGQLHLAGGATFRIEEKRVVIRALVNSGPTRTRVRPLPLDVELQAVLQAGVMTGIAKIQQRIPGTISSFDAIGRFEARRMGPQ